MRTKVAKIAVITVVAMFFAITSSNYSPAAEDEAGTGLNLPNSQSRWNGALDAGDIDHTSSCITAGASPLSGSFQNDPCSISNIYTDYSSSPPGGKKMTDELDKWWTDTALPALKDMTAQLSGFIYTQTQMYALTMDAYVFNKYARAKQQQEYATRKRYRPNEYSCVAASNIPALAKARTISEQMTESIKREMEKRANAVDVSGLNNRRNDIQKRWNNYCSYFQDLEANGGISACEDPETEGTVKNGDIDIEGILLKDTIDMDREDVRAAVLDLLINLNQNQINEKLQTPGSNYSNIIKSQHIKALRNVATHVLASIIARRTPVKYTNTTSGITSGDLIADIRANAGIPNGEGTDEDPNDISENPSYNELMLALTKERFLDPTYYIRVQDSIPAIKREQASLEAYVNMQLNDIYQIQEQINTLLAAKASLRADEPNPVSTQAPLTQKLSTDSEE